MIVVSLEEPDGYDRLWAAWYAYGADAQSDRFDHWSADLATWADAWVEAQLDEEERLAYEQAYAEYEARERARYYAERAMEEELEADRQRWYSIQDPPWA